MHSLRGLRGQAEAVRTDTDKVRQLRAWIPQLTLSPAHLLNHLYWEFSNTFDLLACISSEVLSYFFTGLSSFVICGAYVFSGARLKGCAVGWAGIG